MELIFPETARIFHMQNCVWNPFTLEKREVFIGILIFFPFLLGTRKKQQYKTHSRGSVKLGNEE